MHAFKYLSYHKYACFINFWKSRNIWFFSLCAQKVHNLSGSCFCSQLILCLQQQGLNGQNLTFPDFLKQSQSFNSFEVEVEQGGAERIREKHYWPFCDEAKTRTWQKAKP